MPQPIELLAPAKDLHTGIVALSHGADAVYIGAPAFGARQAAAVSLDDIAALCREAQLYRAKIYVALNTILYDNEIEEALRLIEQLYERGVDAIIVQDMGLIQSNTTPIALHASTQCHIDSIERVKELAEAGIEQVVLARELDLKQTRNIAQACPEVRIEAFVHGSLCVSYSGRCYLSQQFKGRSANRGDCAQLCRLPYTLVDAKDQVILKEQYLLSPKDMNRSQELRQMLEAGIRSFKIEGRLKGPSYVKNTVAYYRQLIDQLIAEHPHLYCRQSVGVHEYRFTPDPSRSFNRGFTSLLHGKNSKQSISINPYTNKSIGKAIGSVLRSKGNRVYLDYLNKTENIVPGDGVCLLGTDSLWQGTSVIKVYEDASIELDKPLAVGPGTVLYRNFDLKFERTLKDDNSARRRIPVQLKLEDTPTGFCLSISAEHYQTASVQLDAPLELAKTFRPEEIKLQLSKLGSTPLVAEVVELALSQEYFIANSQLAKLRREATERFIEMAKTPTRKTYNKETRKSVISKSYQNKTLDYRHNVSNAMAADYYKHLGAADIKPAFEIASDNSAALMSSKHCLKAFLGHCPRLGQSALPYSEPLRLVNGSMDLRLQFDCQECLMLIYHNSNNNN